MFGKAYWKLTSLLLIPVCLFTLVACRQKEQKPGNLTTLHVSCEGDPQTLDPRKVRDLPTATAIHMFYEGLTRNGGNGQPAPALAETITISPDQKTYTFKLRPSAWSNGQPVTAYDFEQTWKSILDPQFPSPNAYQLYVIRGAKDAKEGLEPVEHVGVQAKDIETLVVELEQPTPYFLHLTASHFFYPVHVDARKQSFAYQLSNEAEIVTNGPFKLETWKRQNELTGVPNPYYWDQKSVRLDRIALVVLDNPTALQLFQKGDLQWTGSPLSTLSTDALASLREQGQLNVVPAAGVYLLRFNIQQPPFDNIKMRRAFALALHRSDLVSHVLQGNQEPAFKIIPPSFLKSLPYFQDHDVAQARQLFQESLNEQGLTLVDLPKVSLYYATGERAHKIAQVAQQQWKDVLGINVDLQSHDGKVFYNHLKNKNYQIGIGSWFADFRDPISFLEVFKYKENGTNNTQWENTDYISLLDQSSEAAHPMHRENLLMQAEKVLIQEMPVVPLFYASYNYLKHPSVKEVYFSELGYLDFKHAYIDPNPSRE